jgi:hypothetical protein
MKLSDDAKIEVIYVDEGKTESVRLKNLYRLPEHLSLENIPPTVSDLSDWLLMTDGDFCSKIYDCRNLLT